MLIKSISVTPDSYIIQSILNQFKVHINNTLQFSIDTIKHKIIDRIRELITNSAEVEGILNSDFGKELGLSDPGTAINEIILAVQTSILVEYEPINDSLNGGFTINILRSDYQDVLSAPYSNYVTNNGVVIPWLYWLLSAGTSPLIYGFRVEFNPHSTSTSRTGAIMIKAPGQTWSIPANYAGTQHDNFLTRALIPLQDELSEIVRNEICR